MRVDGINSTVLATDTMLVSRRERDKAREVGEGMKKTEREKERKRDRERNARREDRWRKRI